MTENEYMTRQEVEALVGKLLKDRHPIKLFALNASVPYANTIAEQLGIKVVDHHEPFFEDGEAYCRASDGAEGNVRGHDVYVVSSLFADDTESVNDKLVKLLILCGSLRQASAYSITAVIPHLAYARQDQKDKSRAPVTTKLLACVLESVGVKRFLFVDVHNVAAEQNAFDISSNIDILECKNLHAAWCAENLQGNTKRVAVLSPDTGGLKRADLFRKALAKALGMKPAQIDVVIYDKIRDKDTGKVNGGRIIGDVKDSLVIAVDDMISTGGTIAQACQAVVKYGGQVFAVCATHGLFVGEDANTNLEKIDAHLVVCDTVSAYRLNEKNKSKLHVISTAKLVADAIRRIHSGTGSISELLT